MSIVGLMNVVWFRKGGVRKAEMDRAVHQENVRFVFGIFDVFVETSKMPKTQRRPSLQREVHVSPKTFAVFER